MLLSTDNLSLIYCFPLDFQFSIRRIYSMYFRFGPTQGEGWEGGKGSDGLHMNFKIIIKNTSVNLSVIF